MPPSSAHWDSAKPQPHHHPLLDQWAPEVRGDAYTEGRSSRNTSQFEYQDYQESAQPSYSPPSYTQLYGRALNTAVPQHPPEQDYLRTSQAQPMSTYTPYSPDERFDDDRASPSDHDSLVEHALDFTRRGGRTVSPHDGHLPFKREPLANPVAVPQTDVGLGKPFTRAYSPVLAARGIEMAPFVEFLDNLNIISTPTTSLQLVDVAGGIVGMVPHHYCALIGGGIQFAAKAGNAAVSKTRVALFLQRANTAFFLPRGLHVSLVTGTELRARLGMHAGSSRSSSDDDDLLTASSSSTTTAQHLATSALDRYLQPFAAHLAGLTTAVPAPSAPTTRLAAFARAQQTRQQTRQEASAQKSLAKYHSAAAKTSAKLAALTREHDEHLAKHARALEHTREKLAAKRAHLCDKHPRDPAKQAEKLAEFDRDAEKQERDFAKERAKLDREWERACRHERRDLAKDDKESKRAGKLVWVLVEEHDEGRS